MKHENIFLLRVSLRCIEIHAPKYNEGVQKLDSAQKGAIKIIRELKNMPMKISLKYYGCLVLRNLEADFCKASNTQQIIVKMKETLFSMGGQGKTY